MKKARHKFKLNEMTENENYWADKNMEECLKATCFMVEQFIVWNNLPKKMDKTIFEKTNKYEEWETEKAIWNNFTDDEKAAFLM